MAGAFEADVKGFILVDGEADLTSDAVGTVKWVTERYVRESHPESEVEIVDFGRTGLTGPHPARPDAIQHGWCDVIFRVDGGRDTEWRIQLTKGEGGWAVHRRFDTGTILAAHPLEEPPDGVSGVMRVEIARRIEAEFGGRHAIYGFETRACSHNKILGRCQAEYRLDDPRLRGLQLYRPSGP